MQGWNEAQHDATAFSAEPREAKQQRDGPGFNERRCSRSNTIKMSVHQGVKMAWDRFSHCLELHKVLRVRGVTCPKIYELTPPHGTPLTPRPQELTPCANHHGTPALTDRFLDWFVIFLRDLVHFTSVREFFDLTPNVKERMAHLQDVFYQPKFSDVIPIVGTTYLISKNVIHDGFPHWHTEYIQVLR